MRKSTKLQIFLIIIFLSILAIVIPTTGYLFLKEGERKNNMEVSNFDPNSNVTIDGLRVFAFVSFIDPNAFSYKAHFIIIPTGSFASTEGLNRLTKQMSLYINGIESDLVVGNPIAPRDISLLFTDGDINRYPFESYNDELQVYAVVKNSTVFVPIMMQFYGSLSGWSISAEINDQDGIVSLTEQFSRSGTTKFFSVFIIILMWTLSLMIFILALTLNIRKRKVEPPTLAVVAAMLFALPAIRNVQPSVPAIGIVADAAGFFWNMALISFSLIMLLINYIVMYKKPSKPKQKKDKEMERKETIVVLEEK